MSYRSILTIEDKTFPLLEVRSTMWQKADEKGQAISQVYGGAFEFFLRGTDDDLLVTWATDAKKTYDGSIVLYEWDEDVKVREYAFKKAYVKGFWESYMYYHEDLFKRKNIAGEKNTEFHRIIDIHADYTADYIFSMHIKSESVSIAGIEHSNKW
jgi:hypothetical protein